jgi:hypothetical protein
MKLQDKETLSIAKEVGNVLEGKKEVKEIKFPHKMYGPKGEEVTAKDQEEHEEYTAKGYSHTKPVKEVDEPTAQGEKDFKAKHKVKKSGMKNDGSVVKEGLSSADYKKAQKIVNDPKTKGGNMTQAIKDLEKWKKGSSDDKKVMDMLRIAHESVSEEITISIKEAHIDALIEAKKAGKGKTKLDIDWVGDKKLAADVKKKYKVTVKPTGRTTADISGNKQDIVKMMLAPDVMGWDQGDLEDLFPELFEAVAIPADEAEQSPKQKKYQAFFQKALKKFGVKSPQELEGDKRKEFFDYIDANWEGDNESD